MAENINQPTVFIIFGGTGDLSRKKLIPSLHHLDKQGKLPNEFRIISVARRASSDNELIKVYEDEMHNYFSSTFDIEHWTKFARKISIIKGDFSVSETFSSLARELNKIDESWKVCSQKIFYLSITPDLYKTVLEGIKKTQLEQICKDAKNIRVILEKPFGKSLSNFEELNALTLSLFTESQIYRVDHSVGKETVENILYFRAANPALMDSYTRESIDNIKINYLETIGVEGRGGYFDEFGQTRDMVQSHVLQMLALSLMDIPEKFTPESISTAKTEVLNNLSLVKTKNCIVRGQYINGVIDGKSVPSYLEDLGSKNSSTETYVEINATMKAGKWKGLPITLVSGKRLSKKLTDIVITYKDKEIVENIIARNVLTIRIQPEEGITLKLRVKKPEAEEMENADMNFRYKDSFQTLLPEAYEKILLDIVHHTDAFDITTSELEASWKFIDPIIKGFENNDCPLQYYPAGSNDLM